MIADRYVKVVLSIIAIELGWIALTMSASPVSAQQQGTPVVITGIDLQQRSDFLPVGVLGQIRDAPSSFLPVATTIRNDRINSVPVSLPLPLDVRAVNAIRIDTDRPIKVENVGYTPAQRPGE